jgi:putative mRNA 3-end processing factor
MAFRGARRRRAVDKGFVLSDQCDWQVLVGSVKKLVPKKIIFVRMVCHRYFFEIFTRISYDARTEKHEGMMKVKLQP